jgi:hypothetical protein
MLALIQKVGGVAVAGVLAEHQNCQGSKYHTPNPLVLRCYVVRWKPNERVGYTATGEEVIQYGEAGRTELLHCKESDPDSLWLCGTCAANLEIFLSLMDATNGVMSWQVRREFGNLIRSLGLENWKRTEANG